MPRSKSPPPYMSYLINLVTPILSAGACSRWPPVDAATVAMSFLLPLGEALASEIPAWRDRKGFDDLDDIKSMQAEAELQNPSVRRVVGGRESPQQGKCDCSVFTHVCT